MDLYSLPVHVEEILYVLSLCSTTVADDVANLPVEDIRELRVNACVCMSHDCEVDAK